MIKCYVDCDIMADFLSRREPFFESSAYIFQKAQDAELKLYTSPLAIANVYYLVRREWGSQVTKDLLIKFLSLINITSMHPQMVMHALTGQVKDFEDALQHQCAIPLGCNYILTRHTKDYKYATIQAITPVALQKILK